MPTSTKNGWLAAKKRGRDDEQIERDRKLALLQRQQKKQKGSAAIALKAAVAGKKKPSKKNSRGRASFDTLDSMADFVIDDNSVISDEEDASFDDEESLVDDDISSSSSSEDKNKTKKSVTTKERIASARDEILSLSSDDSDVGGDYSKISSFFSKSLKKYTNKPASLMQKPPRVASGAVSSKVKTKPNHSRKERTAKILGSNHVISLDNSDSDVDDSKMPARNPSIATSSKFSEDFGKEKDSHSDCGSLMSSSELFNVDGTGSSSPLPKPSKKPKPYLKEKLLDLEDTPLVPAAIRKKMKKYQPPTSKTLKKVKKEIDTFVEPTNAPIDLQDSSEDENEEEAMGADFVDTEEYNEDAVAAQSILATTNELSLLILRTMASWTHRAVDGMIVDGALALSSITKGDDSEQNDVSEGMKQRSENPLTSNQKADHTWISNDTMVQILPNVKLSEYQLIGINWLALLHGMRCEVVGGSKKEYTNVNGILADGSYFSLVISS
jgi:hypothetical protein